MSSGKTKAAEASPEEAAAVERPMALGRWVALNAERPGPDGELRDERTTGMAGAFEYAMRTAGQLALTPTEFEAEWTKFLRRKV